AVVPARAGTHTAESIDEADWQLSFAKLLTVVMDPGSTLACPGRRRRLTLPLPPFTDEADEGRKRGGRLATAGVIQKRSGKRFAPVFQHADPRAGFDRLAHIAFEREPETEAVACGALRGARIIEDQFRRRRYLHHAAGLLELPVRQHPPAVADTDAAVIEHILRKFRPAVFCNVTGRRHNGVTLRRAKRHCDHVLRQ